MDSFACPEPQYKINALKLHESVASGIHCQSVLSVPTRMGFVWTAHGR